MDQSVAGVIDLEQYPLHNPDFRADCQRTLADSGALVLEKFLTPAAISSIQRDGEDNQHLAYYTANHHNIYLTPPDAKYPPDHPRNR